MPKPLFMSIPAIADRLKNLTSDVPDLIMNQAATDVERYLLEQASYLNQGNVIMGEVVDKILVQTTATNGRVSAIETRNEEVKKELSAFNKVKETVDASTSRKTRTRKMIEGALYGIFAGIVIVIAQIIAKHFGWMS